MSSSITITEAAASGDHQVSNLRDNPVLQNMQATSKAQTQTVHN